MSLANYTDLQNAVADWLARTDLTGRIPDFITLAESRLSRDLRVRDMEASATVTMTAGVGPTPADYLEWLSVTWLGSPASDLRFVEPDSEEWRFRYRPNHAVPTMFTVMAGNVRIKPVLAGNVTLYYYQKIPALSGGTNWLMTRAPDLYLYYSLAEAYAFVKDDARKTEYLALADKYAQQTLFDADQNKVGRRPLRQAETTDITAARDPKSDGI